MAGRTERAILAGGCFWGMQQLIRRFPGVVSTRVGYSGGDVKNATYRNHGTHAEAIEITFDPDKTSFRNLLEFFFQIHDPTTRNRQGNDVGMSYRSAIFYTNDEQRRLAEDTIADVDASGLWLGRVVTEVAPAGDFWEAEPEHQDYLERYPNGYTCHFVRPGWKLPRRPPRSVTWPPLVRLKKRKHLGASSSRVLISGGKKILALGRSASATEIVNSHRMWQTFARSLGPANRAENAARPSQPGSGGWVKESAN